MPDIITETARLPRIRMERWLTELGYEPRDIYDAMREADNDPFAWKPLGMHVLVQRVTGSFDHRHRYVAAII
jgi:hypothetical protein